MKQLATIAAGALLFVIVGCSTSNEPDNETCDVRRFLPLAIGNYWVYEIVDDVSGSIRIDSTVVDSSEIDNRGTRYVLSRFIDDTLYLRMRVYASNDTIIDELPHIDNDLRSRNVQYDEYGGVVECGCPALRRALISCNGRTDTVYSTAPGDSLPSLNRYGEVIFSYVDFRRRTRGQQHFRDFGSMTHKDFVGAPNATARGRSVNMIISDSICLVEPDDAVFSTTGLRHVASRINCIRDYVDGVGVVFENIQCTIYTSPDSSTSEKSNYRRQLLRYSVRK